MIDIGPMTWSERRWVSSSWKRAILGQKRRTLIEELIQDLVDTQRILVARPETDRSVGVGWVCFTPEPARRILHYVYVRGGGDGVRGLGFARQLLAAAGINTTIPVATTANRPRDLDRARRNNVQLEWVDPRELLRRQVAAHPTGEQP